MSTNEYGCKQLGAQDSHAQHLQTRLAKRHLLAIHSLTNQEMAIGLCTCRADLCKASCCRESCSSSCFCWVMLYLCTNTAGLLSTGSCTRPTYHTHLSLAGHARWWAVTQAPTQLATVNWACRVDCDEHKQVMLGYEQPYKTQCNTCQPC